MEIKELINDCITKLNDYGDRLAEIDSMFHRTKNSTETFSALLELQDKIEMISDKLYFVPLSTRATCGKELSCKLNSAERLSRNLIKEIDDFKKDLTYSSGFDSNRIIDIMFPNQEDDRDEYYNDF